MWNKSLSKQAINLFNGTVKHCLCLFTFHVQLLLWTCSPTCEVVPSFKKRGWRPAGGTRGSVSGIRMRVTRWDQRVSKSWTGGAWMPFSQVQNTKEGSNRDTSKGERWWGKTDSLRMRGQEGARMQLGKPVKDTGSRDKVRKNKGLTQDCGLVSQLPQHMVDGTAVPLLDWELRRDDGWGEYKKRGFSDSLPSFHCPSIHHPSIDPSVYLSTVHPSSTYLLPNIHHLSIHNPSIHTPSIHSPSIHHPSPIHHPFPLPIHSSFIHPYIHLHRPLIHRPSIHLYWATGSLLSAKETVVNRTPPALVELMLWLIKILILSTFCKGILREQNHTFYYYNFSKQEALLIIPSNFKTRFLIVI